MSTENEQSSGQPSREVDVREEIKRDRLSDLRNARNELRTARRTSREMMAGGFDETTSSAHFLDELKQLLLELKTYADVDEVTQAYWLGFEENNIPDWWVAPPPKDSDEWSPVGPGRSAPNYESLEPVRVTEFNGLLDFVEAPPRYPHTFRCTMKHRNVSRKTYEAEVNAPVPRHAIDMGIDLAFRFMSYVGLDVDLSESQQDIELKYADLLEDGSS